MSEMMTPGAFLTARPAAGAAAGMDPGEFLHRAPVPPGGNSPWAAWYGRTLRDAIERQANRDPRSMQRQPGPSELGELCQRQTVSKMAGEPHTNHISSPWTAIVGRAVHSWLAEAFDKENRLDGFLHWLTEQTVSPHPSYPGRCDLYDIPNKSAVDWKVLGKSTLGKLQSAGPSRRYFVQLLLYAKGYRLAGWPVERIVLVALPRTERSLASMYTWEHRIVPEDDVLISQVLAETEFRSYLAQMVLAKQIRIEDIPRTPSSESCYVCDYYRPEAAGDDSKNGAPGCPGLAG